MSRVPSAIGVRSRRALPRGSRTAPSRLGDLEETEYNARIRSGPLLYLSHAVFCYNNYYIIFFPLHVYTLYTSGRGMMRMRIY